MKADTLIARAKTGGREMPSAAALAELKKLIDHNDSVGTNNSRRVAAVAACDLLASHGFECGSRDRLNSVCKAAFGRRSYGTP